MSTSIIRHEVCVGCEDGAALAIQIDSENEATNTNGTDWRESTSDAVKMALPGTTSEEYDDAIRNSIRKHQQKVVCPAAGKVACSASCQAVVGAAYPPQY
jgi:hypothetical protein